MKKKIKKIYFIIIILFLFVLIFLGYYYFLTETFIPKDSLRIVFLNIGQGDAILIQDSYGYNILIDGGPSREIIYKLDKYIPFYKRKIDLMILTHFGLDHVTGLTEVLSRVPVKKVMFHGLKAYTPASLKFAELIYKKNIPFEVIDAPQRIELKQDVLFDFFWPEQEAIYKRKGDDNFTSLVFKLDYKGKRILFTGDATDKVEEELIKRDYDLKSEILKLGHHGSKYSTTLDFLKLVNPEYGVISVGENNFGHPNLRVLKNLEKQGAKILRTDQLGDIIFLIDGQKLSLTTKK